MLRHILSVEPPARDLHKKVGVTVCSCLVAIILWHPLKNLYQIFGGENYGKYLSGN